MHVQLCGARCPAVMWLLYLFLSVLCYKASATYLAGSLSTSLSITKRSPALFKPQVPGVPYSRPNDRARPVLEPSPMDHLGLLQALETSRPTSQRIAEATTRTLLRYQGRIEHLQATGAAPARIQRLQTQAQRAASRGRRWILAVEGAARWLRRGRRRRGRARGPALGRHGSGSGSGYRRVGDGQDGAELVGW